MQTTTLDTHVVPGRYDKRTLSGTGIMTGDGQLSEPSTLRGRPMPTVVPTLAGVQVPAEDASQLSVNTGTTFPQGLASSAMNTSVSVQRARRASAAEKVLEQLRNKDLQRSISTSPRSTWLHKPKEGGSRSRAASMLASVAATAAPNVADAPAGAPTQASATKNVKSAAEGRRPHTALPIVPPPSPVNQKGTLPPNRPRLSRSPSAPHLNQQQQQQIATVVGIGAQTGPYTRQPPPELISLLDGDHHTDELSVRFEAGWPMLDRWLITIGGGAGNGDYGCVSVIYR